MTIKEHEMILIKQREEIFKEIASSKEDLVEEETLDNEVVTPTEEEVAPVTKEDTKVEEEKVDVNEIILPTKEEIEKETKVVEEEPTVVYNPVKMQPTTSLSDLENKLRKKRRENHLLKMLLLRRSIRKMMKKKLNLNQRKQNHKKKRRNLIHTCQFIQTKNLKNLMQKTKKKKIDTMTISILTMNMINTTRIINLYD